MKRMAILVLSLTVTLAACGGSGKQSAAEQQLQRQADLYAIDQIEEEWHEASSTHNINLMMTLWAPDATWNIGAQTLAGKTQIRNFFVHKVGPFQPQNHWVSETLAYKVRVTVNGDQGTLYFECHYVDVRTRKVVSVVSADQNVQKIGGKWLIVSSAGATATLRP